MNNSANSTLEFNVEDYPDKLSGYMKFKFTRLDASTKFEYQRKFETTFKKFSGKPLPQALEASVQVVLDRYKERDISYSTFRSYRAAICFGIANYLDAWTRNALENEIQNSITPMVLNEIYRKAIQPIDNLELDEKEKLMKKTSATKAKRFPQDFYNYLMKLPFKGKERYKPYFLSQSEDESTHIKPSDLVSAFVKANLLIGLRPVEWLNCTFYSEVETKNLKVYVQNAKHTHNRANGSARELILKDITEEEVIDLLSFYCTYHKHLYDKAIEITEKNIDFYDSQKTLSLDSPSTFVNGTVIPFCVQDEYTQTYLKRHTLESIVDEMGRPQKGVSDKVMKSLQKELHRKYDNYLISKGLSTKSNSDRPTLYSTRHQCIANAKSGKRDSHEIAGFFGHASSDTAKNHYGDKKFFWSQWTNFRFYPSRDSILNVTGGKEYLQNCTKIEYCMSESNLNLERIDNNLENSRAYSDQNGLKFES